MSAARYIGFSGPSSSSVARAKVVPRYSQFLMYQRMPTEQQYASQKVSLPLKVRRFWIRDCVFARHGGIWSGGRCVLHHLIHIQRLSDTPCPQHSPRTTTSVFCLNHPVKFVHQIVACDPEHMLATRDLATGTNVNRGLESNTVVRKLKCVARGWSIIGLPYEVLQHRMKSQLVMRQDSHGKRRHVTKSLARLSTANKPVPSLMRYPRSPCIRSNSRH